MGQKHIREIDTSLLPRLSGKQSYKIDWKLAVENKMDIPFIYDDISGVIHLKGYETDGNINYLIFEYNGETFKRKASNVKSCNFGTIVRKYTKINIGDCIKNDKVDITILDVVHDKNKVLYKTKCNKCGYTSLKTHNQAKNCGCACCNNLVVVPGINDICTTDPWMIPYFQGGEEEAKLYVSGSMKEVYPICPDCGRVKDKLMPIREIREKYSIGCTCKDSVSYPNKFLFSMFEQLGIEFKREYRISDINQMRYDFMFKLNEIQYLVEADGGLHFKSAFKTKEEQYKNDRFKDKLAKDNGYILIRISTLKSNKKDIVKNILNSDLNKLLDLSLIDWDKCDVDATNNIVKEVCEYANKHPELSQRQIGEMLQLSQSCVGKYIRKGKEYGWCNYQNKDPNKNRINTTIKSNNTSGVTGVWFNKRYNKWQADIIENGNKHYLGRFNTLEEAKNVRQLAEEKYLKNN